MNITRQMIAAAHDVTMRHKIVLGHELLGEIYQAMKSASPAQRKPLTDEEMFKIAEIAWRHGWASCRDAEYIGEEAEDERWGMVGAEVVQDIAAHGIKGEA